MNKISFGRSDDNDIVIKEKEVSRQHGYLLVDGSKVYVVDDNSLNGVYVNGIRIKDKTLLYPRDKVMVAKKYPLDWKQYATVDSDETVRYIDETSRFDSSIYDSRSLHQPAPKAMIDIPSKMEINQNHAEIYRNGEEGADWKVPMKRNMGDKIGNAVGSTLGCIISIIIVMVFIAILAGLGFH